MRIDLSGEDENRVCSREGEADNPSPATELATVFKLNQVDPFSQCVTYKQIPESIRVFLSCTTRGTRV